MRETQADRERGGVKDMAENNMGLYLEAFLKSPWHEAILGVNPGKSQKTESGPAQGSMGPEKGRNELTIPW